MFLLAGGKFRGTADVFQMVGHQAPFRPQRENDPTPTHTLQACAKNTAKHVHETSLYTEESNSCCSLFCTHPTSCEFELELLSHYPVGLRSNQLAIRVSCALPSFLPSEL